ncbi:SLT domain [Candidatus Nitrotoga sp. BS]|nr:SLT domain [Candidatus Nitrotoga sp. BS]
MRSERRVFIFALKTMQSIQENYSNFIMLALLATGLLFSQATQGGTQTYQPLSASVQISLNHAVSDQAPLKLTFATQQEFDTWLNDTSPRLEKRIPDAGYRADFLKTVYYEATRAGLDPQLVLGLIQVESGFKKYAVSSVGARGYMQVMPFWLKLIGQREGNLFHLRTNLRYGCVILRHYLDIEKGDLFRALGRYNGSLGKPNYPNLVNAAWHKR